MTAIAPNPLSDTDRTLLWLMRGAAWSLFLLPVVLFAWRLSHFQYDLYLPGQYPLLVAAFSLLLAVAISGILASLYWFRRYPRPLMQMVGGYVILAMLHGSLDQALTGDGKLIVFLQAAGFALIMLPIISEKRILYHLIRLNFVLGMSLIVLNTVTIFHWLNLISLPYRQVPRVGGEQGLYLMDPLHFGIFGLTENYIALGNPLDVARLQGYSLEPIHWAYFVYLTLACGLFLLSEASRRRQRVTYLVLFAVIAVHLFFVFSAVAFIVAICWACVIGLVLLWRRLPKRTNREAGFATAVLVLTPGLLIPFMISSIPDLDTYLVAENVLNKGSNWGSKIGFLSLGGALFTRFFPTSGDVPSAGHNLILSTYIRYGYFLTIPLLVYLFFIVKRAVAGTPMLIVAGTALSVLAHTIAVPPQLFYPAGAMWLLIAVGVAFHARAIPAR